MAQDGKKLLAYMQHLGYTVDKKLNIVYLEGIDAETWETNDDSTDRWNDTAELLDGAGKILSSNYCTTEPGRYWIDHPMNPKGAARIAFGQHKQAWAIGQHRGLPALVQVAPVKVHRDFNRDGSRLGDPVDTGNFGINQHGCNGTDGANYVGKWSAGCLVRRFWKSQLKFVETCKATGYTLFDTTVLDGSKFNAWRAANG